jgi:peptidoglycan/LPS O-acetylase OafA/YrhL
LERERNFGLDLTRALAITMVYLSHGVTAFKSLGVGVDLFFLLSGFLIGRIYLRSQAKGTFTFFGFWSARWFRTLPPYIAALALFALADPYFHNNAVHPRYLIFLQNYLGMDGFAPSWSLCVEEHFYLALPLAGFFLLRLFDRRALIWLLPAIALVPQILRTSALLFGRLPDLWFWRTHLHCEGLVLGVWLAYVFVDRPALWQKLRVPAIPLAVLPIAVLIYQNLTPAEPIGFGAAVFLIYAVGYAAWLRLLFDLRWSPTWFAPRLVKSAARGLALASYSIYLVHVLLFTDIRVLIDGWARGPVKSTAILASALALSVVFYFLIERPTISLRDRVLNRSNAAQPLPALKKLAAEA